MIALLAIALLGLPQRPAALEPGRHGHRMHLFEGKLFVFGGFPHAGDRERGMLETWVLDLVSGKWRAGPNLNKPMAFHGSAVARGSIYAVSGQIERLDLGRKAWTVEASAGSVPDTHFAAAALGRKIYTIGGFPREKGSFRSFDTSTREVKLEAGMPGFKPGDHFHVLMALDGKLHVFGGLCGDQFEPMATHQVFDGRKWRTALALPRSLWAKFAVQQVVGHRAFIFDEQGGLVYDARANTWKTAAKLPRQLVMPASYEAGGFIYVLGGDIERTRSRVLRYDIERDVWTES